MLAGGYYNGCHYPFCTTRTLIVMTLKSLPLTEPPVQFAGAISLEETAQGVIPWRIDHKIRDLFHDELVARAAMPAGVRICFVSNTQQVQLEIESAGEGPSAEWIIDLVLDGKLHERQTQPLDEGRFTFAGLPSQHKRIELWLTMGKPTRVRSVSIDPDADAEPFDDQRPKWIAYGSSITQCRTAAGPAHAWPAIAAATADVNVTPLGFGGQCHMDIMIARMIRDLPADAIDLCLGINIQASGTFNPRTFREQAIGMVEIIRDGHPDIPIVVVSPIISPSRESTPGPGDLTLETMRELLAEAVDQLCGHGDRNLHYLSGLKLFNESDLDLLPDGLHPSAEGYQLMGVRAVEHLLPLLGLSP